MNIRFATILLLTFVMMFIPNIAFADYQSYDYPSNKDDSEECVVSNDKFFVIGENSLSSISSTTNMAVELDKRGIEVDSIERIDSSITVINASSEQDLDIYDEAEDIGKDKYINVAPVKRYKVAAAKTTKYSPSSYEDQCPYWQGETFGNSAGFYVSSNEHYGGASIVQTYNLADKYQNYSVIPVFDSGCRYTHKMLEGNVLYKFAYNAITDETGATSVEDVNNHGTGVSSIILSNPSFPILGNENYYRTGVCSPKNTKILPIKVTDDLGYTDDEAVIKGIEYLEWLIDSNLLSGSQVRVINLSIGGYVSYDTALSTGVGTVERDALYKKIKELKDKYDIKCVCASGNESRNGLYWGDANTFEVPGDYDCCMCVMASDMFNRLADYSNTGIYKDITAPGKLKWIANSKSDTAVDEERIGTSYATPIVAGAMNLLLQLDPNMTTNQAQSLLEKTATPMTKTTRYNSNNTFYANSNYLGAGMINVDRASYELTKEQRSLNGYPDGISDGVKISGILYGFKVLSSKNKTVAVTATGYNDHPTTEIIFPKTVKLNDGNTYSVVSIQIPMYCNGLAESTDFLTGDKTDLKITNNIKKFTGYCANGNNSKIRNINIESKSLNSNNVLEGCFNHVSDVDNIIVGAYNNHADNIKYLETIKKAFSKKRSFANVASYKVSTSAKDIRSASVSLNKTNYKYAAKNITPGVVVKYSGKTLRNGTDYNLSFSNNKNVGTAKVVVKGIGDYEGNISKKFTIKKYDVKSAKVVVDKKTINKSIKKIKFTIKIGKNTISKKDGYKLKYGKKTVTIIGKNNLSGKKIVTLKK